MTERPGPKVHRDEHQDLLRTLRELMGGLEHPAEGLDEESLRAVLAFLREGVVPFARREEGVLEPDGEAWESTAFEHAFLEAEIDRLTREANSFLQVGVRDRQARNHSSAVVQRTLCRIEAILELHVSKDDDRAVHRVEGVSGESGSAALPGAEPCIGPAKEGAMEREEIEQFLRSNRWGILSTVGGGRPYGVPVSYGIDGLSVFIATGPGRKLSNLEESRAVCLTVAEVQNGDRWRSVVVSGEAQWLDSFPDRMMAVWALAGRARGRIANPKEWRRLAGGRLLRIDPTEITGRKRGG